MIKLFTTSLFLTILFALYSNANPIPSRVDLCVNDSFTISVPQASLAQNDSTLIYLKGTFGGRAHIFLIGKGYQTGTVRAFISALIPHYFSYQLYAKNKIRQDSVISSSVIRVGNVLMSSIDFTRTQYLGSLGTKIYLKSTTLLTFPQARALATEFGVELATIKDTVTNSYLKRYADVAGTWFNLTDELVEGAWRDVRNRKSAFTKWEFGEPNNFANEDYGTLKTNGFWNDRFRDLPLQCFFEKDIAKLPQITTIYGGNLKLEAPIIAGASYVWFGPSSYSNNNREALVQNFTPSTQGNYFLIMQKGGCTSQDLQVDYQINVSILDTALYQFGQSYEGHDYYVSKFKVSFQQAAAFSQSLGGNLADIYSSAENEVIKNILPASNKWIGLTDTAQEGTYRWITNGSIASFLNWEVGEPNNHTQAENFIQMKSNGKWNDIFADLNTAFALKIKKNAVLVNIPSEILCNNSTFSVGAIATGPQQNNNPIVVEAQNIATQTITSISAPTAVLSDLITLQVNNLPIGTYRLRVSATDPIIVGLYTEQTIRVGDGSHISPLLTIINDSIFTPLDPTVAYQWFRNDSTIAGANTNALVADSPGEYKVQATRNACIGTSRVIQYGPQALQTQYLNVFSASPNPSGGAVYISSGKPLSSITVLSSDGRLVQKIDMLSSPTYTVQLPRPGVYLIKCTTLSGQSSAKRVVKY